MPFGLDARIPEAIGKSGGPILELQGVVIQCMYEKAAFCLPELTYGKLVLLYVG